MYMNKKILILGGAKSGVAAAKLLSKDNKVTLTDLNKLSKEDTQSLRELGVKIVITKNQVDLISPTYDLIVKNPGIMPHAPVIKKAKEYKIPVTNEIEVGYHYLPNDVFIIGITGSNGKTTVTTMVYEILKKMGKKVHLAGNIGIPLTSIVKNIKGGSTLVIEISDHQLLDIVDFKTDISLLTNVVKTHIDYHETFKNYKEAKRKIFNKHTPLDIAVLNKTDKESLIITEKIKSNKKYFNSEENYFDDEYIYLNKEKLIKLEDVKIVGNHNYENILSTLLILNEIYLDKEIIKEYLSKFKGVEHRIEFVKEKKGIKYYNDSKATNPTSTITALKTFKQPIHLILGGKNTRQNFKELNNYLENVKCIYAIGETENIIYEYALSRNVKCIKCKTIKNAVKKIKESKLLETGDVVLLSPAAQSLDQFKNFELRGLEFKKRVEEL